MARGAVKLIGRYSLSATRLWRTRDSSRLGLVTSDVHPPAEYSEGLSRLPYRRSRRNRPEDVVHAFRSSGIPTKVTMTTHSQISTS